MARKAFDFKLLKVLMALLQHGNTYRAAEELGTSQPAVSRALGKLREQLDDPLFIRVSGEFKLTAKAEQLQRELPLIMDRLEASLFGGEFQPEHFDEPIKIAMVGSLTRTHGAKIYRNVTETTNCPLVEIDNFNIHTLPNLIQGEIHAAVGFHLTALPPDLFQQPLGQIAMCVASRKGLFETGYRFQVDELSNYKLAALMTPLMSIPIEIAERILDDMNVAFRCSEVGPILEMLERSDLLFPLPHFDSDRLNRSRFDAVPVYDGEKPLYLNLSMISHRKYRDTAELKWFYPVLKRSLADLLEYDPQRTAPR